MPLNLDKVFDDDDNSTDEPADSQSETTPEPEEDAPDDDEYQANLRDLDSQGVEQIGPKKVMVDRFEAPKSLVVSTFETVLDYLEGTDIEFVPGEIAPEEVSETTPVQLANWMAANDEAGVAVSPDTPPEDQPDELVDRLTDEEDDETESFREAVDRQLETEIDVEELDDEFIESTDMTPEEVAARADEIHRENYSDDVFAQFKREFHRYQTGEKEDRPVLDHYIEDPEERKRYVQFMQLEYDPDDFDDTDVGTSEDASNDDDDDEVVREDKVEEMLTRYKEDPENVTLPALRDELTDAEIDVFDERKRDLDTSSSSFQPKDTEPDRPAKSWDDKTIRDFDFDEVKGVGPKTVPDILEALDEAGIESLTQCIDFKFKKIDGIGEATASNIKGALEDERDADVDVDVGSDEETPDDEQLEERAKEAADLAASGGTAEPKTTVEQRPPAQPSDDDTTTLIIGGAFIKGGDDVVLAEDAVEDLKREIEDHEDVVHFSCVEYGKGGGKLVRLIRKNLDRFEGKTIHVTRPHSKYSDPILEALQPVADVVIKAT
jgi:hypothetical protein